MTHNNFEKLSKEGLYEVVIDSDLNPKGSLTYADAILQGRSEKEIVFSTYICHPSMANNELSGPLVAVFLYNELKKQKNRYYTYRFVFTPETVGTISYLFSNGDYLKETSIGGLIITCAGDNGKFTFKKSKEENADINKLTAHILNNYAYGNYEIIDFSPIGSDERQYCSPGFNLPYGSLMRTMYGKYKEYHTSADNKDFISFKALQETVNIYIKICKAFELNQKYINKNPYCEPFLSKYDLYPDISSTSVDKEEWLRQILYILNYSDGKTSLLDIAEKLEVSILDLKENIDKLINKKILDYGE
jgi:aminopeptidase-like protein